MAEYVNFAALGAERRGALPSAAFRIAGSIYAGAQQTSGHRAYIDRLLSEFASLEAGNALLDRRIEELSAI